MLFLFSYNYSGGSSWPCYVYKASIKDAEGVERLMYQEEWQILSDWDNMDSQKNTVPTPLFEVCLVCS